MRGIDCGVLILQTRLNENIFEVGCSMQNLVAPDIVHLDYFKDRNHIFYGASGTLTHSIGIFHWDLATLYKIAAEGVSMHISLISGRKVQYEMQENILQFQARVARRRTHECLTVALWRVPAVS
jgi:hypothetical protein